LGQHLGVARCYFAEPGSQADEIRVTDDWHRPDLPDLAGTFQAQEFGTEDWCRAYRSHPLAIADVTIDALTKPFAERYRQQGLAAYALVPYLQDKRWVVSLAAVHDEVRAWAEDEISLLEDVVA